MKAIAIVGPTSTGKTSLAVELCKKFNGEIISADSRQIYKYMDIGTGKLPTGNSIEVRRNDGFWDLDGVRIWGYDLVSPDKFFSSYDFAEYALEKLTEIINKGKNVFLVGGTGFYVDTITGRIDLNNNIKPDFLLRSELEKMTTPELIVLLTSLNLEVFEKIDKNNRVRLIRAIEKEKGEKNLSTPLPRPEIDFSYIGLTGPRELLYLRADKWVDSIWSAGLIPETEKLLAMNFGDYPPLHGLVYKTAVSYIKKDEPILDQDSAVQRMKYDVHAYIRRQQTWFKKNPEIEWFDISVDSYRENVYNCVSNAIGIN